MPLEERYLSILTLCLATILWPLVVPISYTRLISSRSSSHLIRVSRRSLNTKQKLSKSSRVIIVRRYDQSLESEYLDRSVDESNRVVL